MIDIGDRIRKRRKILNLTGTDISKASGIAQSTLSQIELNKTSPTLETFFKICEVLLISPSEMLLEDEPTNDPDLVIIQGLIKNLTPDQRKILTTFLKSFSQNN